MVELDFSMVTWSFMYAILLAKLTVFLTVVILSLIVLGRKSLGKAGLYAIFSTQSNDIAMGYPIGNLFHVLLHSYNYYIIRHKQLTEFSIW